MPNWCHNTLTVKGDETKLAEFVQAAQPSEELMQRWYKHACEDSFRPETRTYEEFKAAAMQPLSFDAIVPQPTREEYAAMDEARKVECYLCEGTGERPGLRRCNHCRGTGKSLPLMASESWWDWRIEHWGVKWDASFGEPYLAIGAPGASLAETVAALGGTITPTIAIYKFDTPWGPPDRFLEAASRKFPELQFELQYGEPGNGFAGYMRVINGIVFDNEERELNEVLAPEEMWF